MGLIKEKIVQSAVRLFMEKGYRATSIQDIADDCSIAKGSLYKFFESKEELFVSILKQRQQYMMDEVERIRKMALPRRETYLAEIMGLFQFFGRHGYYISRDYNEFPSASNDNISTLIHQIQIQMFSYYQNLLTRQYGSAILDWKWDVTAMFSGMIREYTFHLLFAYKPITVEKLAGFIAERMDDLVQGLSKCSPQPLLTYEFMKEYEEVDLESLVPTSSARISVLFQAILSIIPDLYIPNARKKELQQVTVLLEEELENEAPRAFLIQALLRDLAAEAELSFYAHQLQQRLGELLIKE
ncbi:TetR/AcrR family transcriptional regulator [Paenibacillus sp. CMAA1739]|uniref:TetR/AcrR family transcriptional regulator n=1 Tax=Paenibacillus ottowii TaxID=2315729 RepID=UPI0011B17380|nr:MULTISPECIES: TetR/AcrR family transcriptional regulator [Paenibacillus]MDP1510013.1 TetR/AcrR family transcriptional regulator [Paenibacillus ottowii]MEC4567980.1 TetR/AcrR family transcriptional regulator [Paenibacillus sp. CMAA1739]QDY85694.1 TetR/AcrR family transcriptional regulator [Paenibacillus polymyxa]